MPSLVSWANQPFIKQPIKNALAAPTIAFACYDLYQLFQKYHGNDPSLEQKNTFGLVDVSLISTALMTPIGIKIPEKVFCFLTTSDQRMRWFGPNDVFERTPFHPRHVMSFINLALALPSFLNVCHYAISKIISTSAPKTKREDWMASWNVFTSRPLQHFVNAVLLKDLSRVFRH
jgi:hypothetical protein